MNQALVHRGPDEEGSWMAPELGAGLGVRRLSIIDLETGAQPLLNEDESIGLVANGEIYNHLALRTELEKRGHRFRSRSDCEVILHLYEEHGVECLGRLNGMFGLAILDRRERRLLLARDPAGMKPLYYTRAAKGFLFASEAKALFASGLVAAEPDWEGVGRALAARYCPAPKTCFRAVERLPAGSFLLLDKRGETQGRFWTMRFRNTEIPRSDEECADELERRLRAAVASHLVADVPVGAFLSGGWDSSLTALFAAQSSARRLKTFSIVFPEEPAENEARFARLVADQIGSEHYEVEFRTSQVPQLMEKVIEAVEEPCATGPAVVVYQLSGAAAREVKTVVGGEGSDELFGGYAWLRTGWAYGLRRFVPPPFVRPLAERVRGVKWGRVLRLLAADTDRQAHLEWHRGLATCHVKGLFHPDVLLAPNSSLEFLSPPAETWASCRDRLQERLSLEFTRRLADGILFVDDKASMARSLEVRLPFLDRDVMDFALGLPSHMKVRNGHEKYVVSLLAHRHLPPEIARRRKYGLHFPMYSRPNREFASYLRETLLGVRRPGLFQHQHLEAWLKTSLVARAPRTLRVWQLTLLALWWDRFLG
jgi:asparagine synthase (glutamine-hydrolysing)